MNQNPFVTFHIPVTKDSAKVLGQIGELIAGMTGEPVAKPEPAKAEPAKVKPVVNRQAPLAEVTPSKTPLQALKDEVMDLDKEGKELAKKAIEYLGGELKRTLPASLATLDPKDYADFKKILSGELVMAEPTINEADDFLDVADEPEPVHVAPQAVEMSLKAYAKEHGKHKAIAILNENGLNLLADLKTADQATLGDILKAVC